MTGPAWLAETFAGIMLVTAMYCASRLVISRTRRRPTDRDVDLVHVVMAVAMAGMLGPRISPLWSLWTGTLWSWAWAVVFGASAAWFAWRMGQAYRLTGTLSPPGRHHLPHLIMCGAMVYLLLAGGRPGAAGAMGGLAAGAGRFPVVALLLAQFMVGYAIWTVDRLPALAPVRARAATPGAAVLAARPARPAALSGQAAGAHATDAPAGTQPTEPGPGPVPLSPRLAACCNVALGSVMTYLLGTLL